MKKVLRYKVVTVLLGVLVCMNFAKVCNAGEYRDITFCETEIAVTDLEIDGYEEELMIGETMSLTANIVPSNSTGAVVTFKSSDADIATVKSSGTVTGKKAGKVVIYVTCGDITKELPITVKVKTKSIEVNSKYIVIQQGKRFQINAKVIPATADNTVTYRSLDEAVAVVSVSGMVTAKGCGTTSILVSNGYSQVAVTVVVNETVVYNDECGETNSGGADIEEFPKKLNADEYNNVTSAMLKYYYENNMDFEVEAEKYTIRINSSDIVNYENELNTVIDFENTLEGLVFELDNLCGKITLDISKIIDGHKFFYLYNNDKMKYERIDVEDISSVTIDTAGKYLIAETEISNGAFNAIYIIGGIFIVMIGVMVYIVLKKKYWFW